MNRINPRAAAPMPKAEEEIKNNSMKLFAYLMTIAGLADYPENTRMFRQKNLILTHIYNATGITDKTVKLYMYYLEENGLIVYKGEHKFDFSKFCISNYEKFKDYRADIVTYSADIWKLRKKEKDSVYLIPRPMPFTPVPEITLTQLNEDFHISELELKVYLFCCKYRDECVKTGKSYKAMTYEDFRTILDLKSHHDVNKEIFLALAFLEKLQLISYTIGYISNEKGAKIPCFKITEVGYYIGEPLIEFGKDEMLTEKEVMVLHELNKRVVEGYDSIRQKQNV
jgi:hypothetical protein